MWVPPCAATGHCGSLQKRGRNVIGKARANPGALQGPLRTVKAHFAFLIANPDLPDAHGKVGFHFRAEVALGIGWGKDFDA